METAKFAVMFSILQKQQKTKLFSLLVLVFGCPSNGQMAPHLPNKLRGSKLTPHLTNPLLPLSVHVRIAFLSLSPYRR